mgnify:FL=1
MMKKLAHALICCIAAAAIAGCATSPQPRFYMLNSTPPPEGVPAVGCSVSVGPVSVPAAVDRPQIVIRTGPNQVFINEFDRWAAPLKNDIGRIVAENLASMLGTKQVTLFLQATAADASYRIAIDILRFDSEPGLKASLDALWTVRSAKEDKSRRGRTTRTETAKGDDYAALAAAHSRALGHLSAEIAETIRELETLKP